MFFLDESNKNLLGLSPFGQFMCFDNPPVLHLGYVPSSFLPSLPAAAATAVTAAAAAATAVSIAICIYSTAVPAAATAAAVTAAAGSSGRKEAGTNPWACI